MEERHANVTAREADAYIAEMNEWMLDLNALVKVKARKGGAAAFADACLCAAISALLDNCGWRADTPSRARMIQTLRKACVGTITDNGPYLLAESIRGNTNLN